VNKRKLLFLVAAFLIISAIPSGVGQALAQSEQSTAQTRAMKIRTRLMSFTPAQRIAAAERSRAKGALPGKAGLTAAQKTAAADPGGIPHYFGPYANYANSPMPKGSVANVTMTSGGLRYTPTPTVTITDAYGTGTGATAAAIVTGGVIASISVTNGGTGYTAPVVAIADATGSGATANATIGGTLTGGIRKFVNSVPLLGPGGANNLGQYLPVAVPDTTTYPGSDYYEIELREYSEKMHSDLPATRMRGYVQVKNGADVAPIHFLGPVIVATRDMPVRIKFTNKLPTGAGGDLFLPVDTTVMGSGKAPDGSNYPQNRATIHNHGNNTVWISDGTPHQWVTPAGEATAYPKGVSAVNVPDMPDPGPGALTFYYTNQQSARLMFYHDHAYGITRLNVMAGEAAGYLITDQVEQDMINGTNLSGVNPGLLKVLPGVGIPLVIQDRTFVDATTIPAQDPTWNSGTGPRGANGKITTAVTGDLWYPHVYMPNQNPWDISGMNAFGRWVYGPWFWPPATVTFGPIPNPYYDPINAPWEPPQMPSVPNPSAPAEAFVDTPIVNGTAYPYLSVEPKAYRFRILNAANDRFWNLQLYKADPAVVTADGRTLTEVKMTPACNCTNLPPGWPQDGRAGGVPDPTMLGPTMVQIGTEGGFLPAPVVLPTLPINWNMDQTNFDMGVVNQGTLILGPAERADILVDFSAFAGQTLILYNDAPAPFPAIDARYDYYTGKPDQLDMGGSPTVYPGYGPNTRTIMQIRVGTTVSTPSTLDLPTLEGVFAKTAAKRGVFEVSQDTIIVPDANYNSAYNASFPVDQYARIYDFSKTFQTVAGNLVTFPFEPKASHDEMGATYDTDYGRMMAILGVEIGNTTAGTQQFILYPFASPPVELIKGTIYGTPIGALGDGTQFWKITHNGVDTHTLHTHLFNMQLINRVAWDNALRLPDPNELGWKETLRINPLQDTIVALRPIIPVGVPFKVPNSQRPIDPTKPVGTMLDPPAVTGWMTPDGTPTTVINQMVNYGWEYVFHCHLLAHEEMDMMHSMGYAVAPDPPVFPAVTVVAGPPAGIRVTWGDRSNNETGFIVQRATDSGFTANFTQMTVGPNVTTYMDTTATGGTTLYYRILAVNTVGSSIVGFPQMSAYSVPSTVVSNSAPSLQIGRTSLNFASKIDGDTTPPQAVNIRNGSGGTLSWTTASNRTWLAVTPASGTQSGKLTISVLPAGLVPGVYTGTITITAPGAIGSPGTITVRLTVYPKDVVAAPQGVLATPAPAPAPAIGAQAAAAPTAYSGNIPVTGWALDDIAVASVKIWRDSVAGEPNGLVFIGNATFVEGVRPDIEAAYPNHPLNQRAGWGYMLLSNALPNGGNGTFVLHAIAEDQGGLQTELGKVTITVNNQDSELPFGTIDTPGQGGTVSSASYVNFGWALTAMPHMIPFDGSTITVFVDGVPLGHPTYNQFRADVAAQFPGLANSNGAVGYYYLNPALIGDGLHTIAWTVTDNDGYASGIGSRFFEVLLSGSPAPEPGSGTAAISLSVLNGYRSSSSAGATFRRGFDLKKAGEALAAHGDGILRITVEEADRLELQLGPVAAKSKSLAGYQIVRGELRKLPVGSTLDRESGTFYWQLGPGFLKDYDFVFVDETARTKSLVRVTVIPKRANVLKQR